MARKTESYVTQSKNLTCCPGYVKIVIYCTSYSQNICSTIVSAYRRKALFVKKLTYRNRFPRSFSLVERGSKTWKDLERYFLSLCAVWFLVRACNFTNKELTFVEVYWSTKGFEIPTPSFPANDRFQNFSYM